MEPAERREWWPDARAQQDLLAQTALPPSPPVRGQRVPEQRARFRTQFLKSELCRFYPTLCNRGDRCNFAHSVEELHRPPDLTKTSICKAWKAGQCRLESGECAFAHGHSDLRVTSVYLKSAPCKMFLKRGRCDLGSACRHAHSFAELRSAQIFVDQTASRLRGRQQPGDAEHEQLVADRPRNATGVPPEFAPPPQQLEGIAELIQRQGKLREAGVKDGHGLAELWALQVESQRLEPQVLEIKDTRGRVMAWAPAQPEREGAHAPAGRGPPAPPPPARRAMAWAPAQLEAHAPAVRELPAPPPPAPWAPAQPEREEAHNPAVREPPPTAPAARPSGRLTDVLCNFAPPRGAGGPAAPTPAGPDRDTAAAWLDQGAQNLEVARLAAEPHDLSF